MVEFDVNSIEKTVNLLQVYRSGWSNDIREGWNCGIPGAKDLKFQLYEISGSIILALEQKAKNRYRDKMAMFMVQDKLRKLVKSEEFDKLLAMSEAEMCMVITSGTLHHIRIMFECLEVLTA